MEQKTTTNHCVTTINVSLTFLFGVSSESHQKSVSGRKCEKPVTLTRIHFNSGIYSQTNYVNISRGLGEKFSNKLLSQHLLFSDF